jgi:hypothetical protein
MKKLIIFLSSIILLIIICITIYWNLPIDITRHSDIKYGNSLIQNIETYHRLHKKLPKNDDYKTLEKLGFKMEQLGIKPDYTTDSTGSYELTYLEGFDGPYLIWNSNEKK